MIIKLFCDHIFIRAEKVGYQIELRPEDLMKIMEIIAADIA